MSALLAALVEDSSSSDVLALNPTIPSGVLRFVVAAGRVVLVGNSALQPAPASKFPVEERGNAECSRQVRAGGKERDISIECLLHRLYPATSNKER